MRYLLCDLLDDVDDVESEDIKRNSTDANNDDTEIRENHHVNNNGRLDTLGPEYPPHLPYDLYDTNPQRGNKCWGSTRIMQFPERFYGIWVLQPKKGFNYFEKFNDGKKRITYEDYIIGSGLDKHNRQPCPNDNWLFEVLKGKEGKNPLFDSLKINPKDDAFNEDDLNNLCENLDTIMAYGDIKLNELWCVVVLDEGEQYVLTQQDMFVWFSFLKSQIPVRLVSEHEMPPVALPSRGGREEDDDKKTMEYLGVYRGIWRHEEYGEVSSLTEIAICPTRIKKYAQDHDFDPKDLFVVVYLHELAHAALDSRIEIKEDCDTNRYFLNFNGESLLYTTGSASALAMEESLANMIMLQYLECYSKVESEGSKLFEDAKRFVESQIPEYRFGIHQFEAGVDWIKWREYKSKHKNSDEKHKNSDEKLEKWFCDCFNDGKNIIPKEVYTPQMFDCIFDKDS